MNRSTVTQKGRVTIPVELREAFHIKAGQQVEFLNIDGRIMLVPVETIPLTDLFGCLPKPKRTLSIQEINDVIGRKI